MVRKTLEVYECDKCGEAGQRYTVNYPDGILSLDRCERHNRSLMKLRDEPGMWVEHSAARRSVQISTPEDIERQRNARRE